MINGHNIYLAAIEREDLPLFMTWRNNPDFRMHFREYREINSDMQQKWYEQRVLNDPSTIMFSIVDKKTGKTIGCCGICYVNWVNRCGDISIYIGENNVYLDERAEEACILLLDYGFNILGLHKLWSEIYELDVKRKEMVIKLNFHLDGIQREHYFYNGKWWDSFLFSILENEFKENFKIYRLNIPMMK